MLISSLFPAAVAQIRLVWLNKTIPQPRPLQPKNYFYEDISLPNKNLKQTNLNRKETFKSTIAY